MGLMQVAGVAVWAVPQRLPVAAAGTYRAQLDELDTGSASCRRTLDRARAPARLVINTPSAAGGDRGGENLTLPWACRGVAGAVPPSAGVTRRSRPGWSLAGEEA